MYIDSFIKENDVKKIIFGILIITMVSLVYSAIFAQNTNTGKSKTLIIFYSKTGHTREVANIIKEITKAHIAEIEVVNPYPVKYRETTAQAKKELDSGYLPPIKQSAALSAKNLAAYDTIIICSPIWWHTISLPVRTFLSQNKLVGKKVALLTTHGGDGMGNSVSDLGIFCPQAKILDSLTLRDYKVKKSQKEIEGWLKKIGLVN